MQLVAAHQQLDRVFVSDALVVREEDIVDHVGRDHVGDQHFASDLRPVARFFELEVLVFGQVLIPVLFAQDLDQVLSLGRIENFEIQRTTKTSLRVLEAYFRFLSSEVSAGA